MVKWLVFAIISLLFSCSKQSAPEIDSIYQRTTEEQKRLESCSSVNFQAQLLEYQNVILLFQCTKWDKEFPEMFASIMNTRADSWNQFFRPLNDVFLEGNVHRERTFKNIRDLDEANGLDDLSYVLQALNENNFFDSTSNMFKCVENPSDEKCRNRKSIPRKNSLKNILTLVNLDNDSLKSLYQILKDINVALRPKKKLISFEINKFKSNVAFNSLRLKLIDSIAEKFQLGLSEEDRVFLTKLLNVEAENTNTAWIYQWIQDQKMNREKFKDLIEYPVLVNPNLITEMNGVKELYNKAFQCSFTQDNKINELINFDLKAGVGDYLEVIKEQGYKRFYEFSSYQITGMKTASPFCKELAQNPYQTNLLKVAFNVDDFFKEKKFYDLVRFILKNSTAKGDKLRTFEENIYLGSFLSSEIYRSFNNLNVPVFSNTREFYPLVFDVLKQLPPSTYVDTSLAVEEMLSLSNAQRLKGVADYWQFFNEKEKNFLFNFIDRHFDEDVDFTLLIDFYSKLLADIIDNQRILQDGWSKDEKTIEQSYLALQDLFYNFSGPGELKDFKKFFSRDHIIKVLEILSSGEKIVANARLDLKYFDSDDYFKNIKKQKYKYDVRLSNNQDDFNAKDLLSCLKEFSSAENSFYIIVKNFPDVCQESSKDMIAIKLYGWMNDFNKSYSIFNLPFEGQDSIFDEKGVLSPAMLSTSIALIKNVDDLITDKDASKIGVGGLFESISFYLNTKNGIRPLENLIDLTSDYLDIDQNNNKIFRNSLVKSYVQDSNFKFTSTYLNNLGSLFMDYSSWLKNGKYNAVSVNNYDSYDPRFSCEKMINQKISPYPCPDKAMIKKVGNDLLFRLQNVWEPEMGSPVGQLIQGAVKDGGLNIPLNSPKATKYRLTLEATLRYLFDTFDKNMKVNNETLEYTNPKEVVIREKVTTLERIETVIREVSFSNNYLGASYLNHVVFGENYNEDVVGRKNLLSKCLQIPTIRCGKKMSNDELRMANNALNAYDALLDANNGRGKDNENRLKYGNYLKAFQQSLIASSSKDAQELTFLPLKDEVLKRHNGIILSQITLLNGFSNSARFVMDRVGRDRKSFENFLAREDFKRVDRLLMNGFEVGKAKPVAEKIISKLISKYPGHNSNLFEEGIDWVSALNYNELRLLEDTVSKAAVIGSYLGTPEVVFNFKGESSDKFLKYKTNNLFQMFMAVEKLIDYWTIVKDYFPADAKFIDALVPINNFLTFIVEKLNSSVDPNKNTAYVVLNDTFSVLQTILFDNVQDFRIAGNEGKSFKGLDFIITGLKEPKLIQKTYSLIRELNQFKDVFFENEGKFFNTFGSNLKKVVMSNKVDLTSWKNYFEFTSKNAIRVSGDSRYLPNFHYDEPFLLIKYLNKKNDQGIKNIQVTNNLILKENLNSILDMINSVLPPLVIISN